MSKQRVDRLNSLLKEVISDVIHKQVNHPDVHKFTTVTGVEITKDLKYAKVHISILGTEAEKKKTIEALRSAAGFIALNASKQVVMRYFPALSFYLDESVDKHMRIDEILSKIHEEEKTRSPAAQKPGSDSAP